MSKDIRPHGMLERDFLILLTPMNVKFHSIHHKVFMNFYYSYPPLRVSRTHSRIEKAFLLYSPLWVSNLTVGLKEIFFNSHPLQWVSRDLKVSFKKCLKEIFVNSHQFQWAVRDIKVSFREYSKEFLFLSNSHYRVKGEF